MIYWVGNKIPNSELFFTSSTFEAFDRWINQQLIYQIDTETSVTNSIVERKLKLIQFGDSRGREQWVIQPAALTQSQAIRLVEILNNPLPIKIAHNISFEYQILKKYGVILSNLYDTMLMDKVLWCGYSVEPGFYSLAGLYKRYLFKELDKELQTSFDVDSFSVEQIFYAAQDVRELAGIRRLQIDALRSANLLNVAALENEAVCGFAEIESNGMLLDQIKWRENIALAQPVIDEALGKLEGFLRSEEFRDNVIELGFLTDKDSLNINWNSTLDKKKVFNHIIPGLEGITQPIIKKYIKNNPADLNINILQYYLDKDFDTLNTILVNSYKDWLLEEGLLIPTDTSKINWQSPTQRLQVFKIVEPQLKSTDKQELADCSHPIIEAYQEYINATKLKTSFGEEFITKNVDSDGRVRTHFNQILETGRVSSSRVNIQQIPANEIVGNRYRNAFIADEGWEFIDSDYKSMELIAIAYFSQDKVWLDAIKKDYDIHSVCSEQVFKDKWREATEEGCRYYQLKEDGTYLKDKCKCKKHKSLRTLTKTISFMLVFGGSKYRLSAVAKISLDEAAKTIEDYFNAFPGISGILDAFARFGLSHGYIMTAKPFNRRRYFEDFYKAEYDKKIAGSIERKSKNQPVQGSMADVCKLALILMYWQIKDNNLWNKVKLVAQVHDQISANTCKSISNKWQKIMHKCMIEAGELVIPGGLLDADTTNTKSVWSK